MEVGTGFLPPGLPYSEPPPPPQPRDESMALPGSAVTRLQDISGGRDIFK